ncbi:DsrE family protein [Halothiobacillus sp. 15-55-196]|jgi:predicted peroxiredoxin|uniref:DsrE family protein n=1 Tax=Halothiobacillus sp. 15-55-196 TaxID=1970382 RepID=UPI0025C60C81|nr:DsrE family protein [Halothiobacillus sp. 15-55-196]
MALILSRDDPGSVRAALSLSLAAIAAEDTAVIFFTQTGVRFLQQGEQDAALAEMRSMAQEEGVRLIACSDSLLELGLQPDKLISGVELAGALSFYRLARQVAVSLYI